MLMILVNILFISHATKVFIPFSLHLKFSFIILLQ